MPEKHPPLEPVKTRGAFGRDPGAQNTYDAGRVNYVVDRDAAFAFAIRNLGGGGMQRASERVADTLERIFKERTSSMLDDLAEIWWRAEHEGARVRPFASLPIADRAELRGRVKKLLAERVADALGDQAVLEAEKSRLLDLPARAVTRAWDELDRLQQRDRSWLGAGATVEAAIFAAGHASFAHLGDGGVARLRRGKLEHLTRAHTLANMYEDENPGQPVPSDLPDGVVTRALGAARTDPHLSTVDALTVPVEKGDLFLLMTGSLLDHTDDAELTSALRRHGVAAAPRLVEGVASRAGRNLCAVAVEIL